MKRIFMKKISWLVLGGVFFAAVSAMASKAGAPSAFNGYTPEDCIECHRSGSDESSLQISIETFEASVHGQSVTCMECHTAIRDESHMEQSDVDVVACDACHPTQSQKTGWFSRLSSFQIASHPKADFATAYRADNCLGCHQGIGAHGETKPINDQTCFLCHTPNSKDALWGTIHAGEDKDLTVVLIYLCFFGAVFIVLLRRFLDIVFIFPWHKKEVEGDRH
ncbi:MAG: hypothetical protein V2B19_31810 [Pseudomonadota bacterium]